MPWENQLQANQLQNNNVVNNDGSSNLTTLCFWIPTKIAFSVIAFPLHHVVAKVHIFFLTSSPVLHCESHFPLVCLWLPPPPRDGGTVWTAIQVHAVNLIEIRLGERWQPISNQSWVTGSPTTNKADCHWWVPKSRLTCWVSNFTIVIRWSTGGPTVCHVKVEASR